MITKIEKIENDIQDLYGLYPPHERDAGWHDLQETLVSAYREELEAAEVIAKYTAEGLEALRAYGAPATREALKPETRRYKLTTDEVSWISADSEISVSRNTTPLGKSFWLGSITELSGRTKVPDNIGRQDTLSEVNEIIAGQIAAKLDAPDKRNRALRPLSKKKDHTTVLTEFNAYSGDAVNPSGWDANQIRVGLLEDSRPGDRIVDETEADPSAKSKTTTTQAVNEPVYLIYAIVHHDDDDTIYKL
jgi:hypothetical protein